MTTYKSASHPTSRPTARLVFPDGSFIEGLGVGAFGVTSGEICFNTSMTGYQEILTDPSYSHQIITFTFPHIGNIGVNAEDIESEEIYAKGAILREIPTLPSNYRAEKSLDEWMKAQGATAIAGVDTRALTRKIRKEGACNVVICYPEPGKAIDEATIAEAFQNAPSHEGLDLAKIVCSKEASQSEIGLWRWNEGFSQAVPQGKRVVVIDYGCKKNICRHLVDLGFEVHVVPGTASYQDVINFQPHGVLLSNGPGDPAATAEYAATVIQKLIQNDIPVYGICLGHQLLALALGAKTKKMEQGHRGANHPVKNLKTGAVEITSQNHGFVVDEDTLPSHVEVTHRSLFDGTIEGIALKSGLAFSVQYHPESSPGPHDSHYLFQQFIALVQEHSQPEKVVNDAKA